MTVDLSTTYLGLPLRGPIVASASPLTGTLDSLRALEEAGIAAVVLPSLFEEQIEHEQIDLHDLLEHQTHSVGEALTWFPELEDYNTGPERYLEHLAAAKAALEVPVIASLNGVSVGGWVRYARLCEDAGADALEEVLDELRRVLGEADRSDVERLTVVEQKNAPVELEALRQEPRHRLEKLQFVVHPREAVADLVQRRELSVRELELLEVAAHICWHFKDISRLTRQCKGRVPALNFATPSLRRP